MPAGYTDPGEAVLRIDNLTVFFTKKRVFEKAITVKAVDGVSLSVARGEILALVGESGSGKTTLGRAAIGLTRPSGGSIVLRDGEGQKDVGSARGRQWKKLRKNLQMIFQDPFASIDPNMRVYEALRIPLAAQGVKRREEVSAKISDVIKRVGLPEQVVNNYVFQLSGGQRQRIGIARVLLFDPSVVVADEPVSMLDASLKGDILHIIENESRNGVAFLFITHDMAVAKVVAHRIAVMYLGKIVEIGPAGQVIADPLHPYTKAMLQASPTIDPSKKDEMVKVNVVGELPLSTAHPAGCKFHPRCPYVMDVCKVNEPQLKEAKPGHFVACWLF